MREKKNLKQKLRELFGKDRDRYYSGEELADTFGVTRAAVWKAIEALRTEGIEISGTPRLGYRLAPDSDIFNEAGISVLLNDNASHFYRIECYDTVTSTNTVLKERSADAVSEGLVVIAEQQTAGRGRMGRSFYSPKGSGIYISIFLRPEIPATEAVNITAAAAVAAAAAVESSFPDIDSGSVGIKWVNDLYLCGHKICGILTEGMLSMESGRLDYAIVGVGFNLSTPEGGWPEEIKDVAGSLPDGIAGVGARTKICASFLNHFLSCYRGLGSRAFLEEYRRRMFITGKEVDVIKSNGESRAAEVLGIDEKCRLLVRYSDDGLEEAVSSGEVRVRISQTD